jgi:hypothetical protein
MNAKLNGDAVRKWWPVVTSMLGAVVAVLAVVWATSYSRADSLRRLQTVEERQGEHIDTNGHPALSERVTEQGVHLVHLKARADKADVDRSKILDSVGRLENSAARMEALLEALERRPPAGPAKDGP